MPTASGLVDDSYANFADQDGYHACCERAASLGFEGKWAIHSSQIVIANEVFSLAPAQVDAAREIEAALARSVAEGSGAVAHNGMLVDIAHAKLATTILERARMIEERDSCAVPLQE